MTALNTRLISSIVKMLGEQNGCSPKCYTWVWQKWGNASTAELSQLQAGWQVSSPEFFSANGIYVL
jgi:hypothetical protein